MRKGEETLKIMNKEWLDIDSINKTSHQSSRPNWFFHVRPTLRCPICGLSYWIERTCDGTFDHTTGNFLPHDIVMAVPIICN